MKKTMMAPVWSLILLLATLRSCGSESRSLAEKPVLEGEEARLEKIGTIDTTSLPAVLDLDAIEGYEALDTLSAEAWILVEDSLGLLISSKNADQRMYPASLTKMMTCLLTLEHGHLSDSITITKDLFHTHDCRVRAGDGYVAGHLVREMMMLSDNVAAYALARHVAGDTVAFLDRMNQKAHYLGMEATHFANPNGMPNDSNYSTARDLLALSRYCMGDTAFASIVGTSFLDIPLTDGRHLPSHNTNALLLTYDGCLGVKTGYTRKAGSCLASAASRDGVTLFLILLKSNSYASRFSESAALLDYGFRVMDTYRKEKWKVWKTILRMYGMQ